MLDQYVCENCGYNMIGYYPIRCPFCGASRNKFITANQCSRKYTVEKHPVTELVTCLTSAPRLGYEHAAYHIKSKNKHIWIDCPSCFKTEVPKADIILFTHHHFLGASNLYKEHFDTDIYLHHHDAKEDLCKEFPIDTTFKSDFTIKDIEAKHIDGHTKGFTIYFFNSIVFLCDYVFFKKEQMKFNPYGNTENTRKGGEKLRDILQKRDVSTVCGYNYISDYDHWFHHFEKLNNTS